MSNLLEIRNVSKIFRVGGILAGKKITAVDDVSLTIGGEKPTVLSVVGESGCGKTTLCKMILQLHKPEMGEILLNGKAYSDKRNYNARAFRLDVQPIFQNPYETFSSRKPVDSYLFNTALRLGFAKNRKDAEELIDDTLKSVGMSLEIVRKKYLPQFSGGELQRISIARALIVRPKLIIADEPVAAIDASMKMNIINLFRELKDKYSVSFVYITHDLSTAYYVSDYIATLYSGSLIEFGPAKLIMDKPAHPYTELLMNAVPKIGDKWRGDSTTPDIDAAHSDGAGCKFAARCAYAGSECRQGPPALNNTGDERKVLCNKPLS